MQQRDSDGLNIEHALGVLRRRAPWIVLCVVLVAGSTYGFSKHQTKKYTATASLVFNNNQLSQQVAGLQVASSGNAQPQQETNLKLVQLGDMAEKTAIVLAHAKGATLLARDLTEGKNQGKLERERTGRIEHRQRLGDGDLAEARRRHRERVHRRVRLRAAERQPRLLRLGAGARQQAAGGTLAEAEAKHRRGRS